MRISGLPEKIQNILSMVLTDKSVHGKQVILHYFCVSMCPFEFPEVQFQREVGDFQLEQ